MVFAEAGELALHALFQFALEEVGNVWPEGLVRSAEKPRARTIAGKGTPLHKVDEGGRIVGARTQRFFHDASHGGSTADGGERFGIVTGLTLKGIMPAGGAHEGAKEHQAIGDTSDLWKKLGDLESVELCRDRSEGPANLGGRIGLGVDEVHLGRTAVEMKVDDRLVGRTDPGN
jgi:hypothetical protein